MESKNVAIITAYPDDETIWTGGTILGNPSWQCIIVCLCRGGDTDRAPKFFKALEILKSKGIIGDLDDGSEQFPLGESVVETAILKLIPKEHFDIIISHNPSGEYTSHRRHNEINGYVHTDRNGKQNKQEGFAIHGKPYYAFWSYKIYYSDRFDLMGNSLAILSGIASRTKALKIITWIEKECRIMNSNNELAVGLPPNFFPFIRQKDHDWHLRYSTYNKPGDYHNGGIWPFICGLYIAALVAAGKYNLAEKKLRILTETIELSCNRNLSFGFNEWIKAQDGKQMGVDWQTWSAALYLYAVQCVEEKRTPIF